MNRPNAGVHEYMLVRISNALTVSLICELLLFAPESAAQQTNGTAGQQPPSDVDNRRNEFGVWGGISFDATTLIGKTPDARFGNMGLRYGHVLAANQSLAFSWTIDVVPVAVLSVNRFTIVPTGSGSLTVQRRRERTYGAGLSPIGLKLNFTRTQMLQPFVSGSGGFLFFSNDVPVPGAARFNFTYDLAVEFKSSETRAVLSPSATSTNTSPMVIVRRSIPALMFKCSTAASQYLSDSADPTKE